MVAEMDTAAILPPELAKHVASMRQHLAVKLDALAGFLPFDAFMHEALYAPGLGYYVTDLAKFGTAGDFVTAPEISPLFGRVVARNIAPVLDAVDSTQVVEYGPGSGALADAIIAWCIEHERPIDYAFVEVSPALAARQRARLCRYDTAAGVTMRWLQDPVGTSIRGVVIANEVADALPVRRFRRTVDGVSEIGLRRDAAALVWSERPANDALRADVAALERRRGAPLPQGYTSEYAPGLADWLAQVAATLSAGLLLVVDYGAGAPDYYSDERDGGTFRCHFRHRAFDDPLLAPGVVDMTAWVDFTALAEAGLAAGLTPSGFTSQAAFLMGGGLVDECTGRFDPVRDPAVAAAIRTLTLPGEMGERFRFLGLQRGTLPAVAGFGFRDLLHSL